MIHNSIAGSIINIASINGDQAPCSTASAYCATKAGLIQLTKQLVGELSPHQIRINAISPGLFYTDMTKCNIDENKKLLEEKIPLGFIANPNDLDAAVLFLSSNRASRYMTGSCLTIDGGASANCRLV
jgi:NAD(P)-dependent dehydrogenase (short-subunit alcohol dehydrogenase family)